MGKINQNTIKQVAKLAKLPLTQDEEQTFSSQLSKIVDYIDQLDAVDTSQVEPTYNVTGLGGVTAKDSPAKSLSQEEALQNAHSKKDGFFQTKGVFGNE